MRAVAPRFVLLAVAAAILFASGGASAGDVAATAAPLSHGLAIRVTVPGGPGAAAGAVTAPKDGVAMGGALAYPADGSAVRASSVTASAFTVPGAKPVPNERGGSEATRITSKRAPRSPARTSAGVRVA